MATISGPELIVGNLYVVGSNDVSESEQLSYGLSATEDASPLRRCVPPYTEAAHSDVVPPQRAETDEQTRMCLPTSTGHDDGSKVQMPFGRLA